MTLLAPRQAFAGCVVGGVTVDCGSTSTTDTTFPANAPNDRNYQGLLPTPVLVTVSPLTAVTGNGLAISNAGTGGVTVTNNGSISVDAGKAPTAGGTAALSLQAAGGVITYTGGNITNNGSGNAFDATQTGGVGSVDINVSGDVAAASGSGIVVRDVATSTGISVTATNVTALTAGQDGIDAQSQSSTGNVTEVANGDVKAGNAGMVAAILSGGATGDISVTANGGIDARFGVDAENFGTGSTSVTTVGAVTATTGNGIFALSTGGDVTVTAGDVTSTGNTAIFAQQAALAGAGDVNVTTGDVSGTTGIYAVNSGTGGVGIIAHGTVTGTAAEGILTTGNAAVSVTVDKTVTGATKGLSLVGGTGGTGNISVTGAGGFVGGSDDAANIQNNGAGTVTVDISGASSSTGGNGVIVRDTALGGDISVTTGAVTALTAGKNGVDAQSQSSTADVTEVANGDVKAGNAGMVAAIFPAGATGDISVTANGGIDARFGVDAENFGKGSTSVTTVGAVTATTGNGIFALSTGGDVTVTAGDVTSTGNTAIFAQQSAVAGTGDVNVTTGDVSGTTGIYAVNSGTGVVGIIAHGTVTGTAAEGILTTGNAAVSVTVDKTVTGATKGLSLVGGTGGTGNISVTGAGGFVGGSDDAANIQNNGAGTVTVDISGASSSTGGNGVVVRDTALGGEISVTTGAVTALTAGKNGIDVLSQSSTGNLTEVANGDIKAGNAGMVAAIFPAGATGDISVTANGGIDARFGVDAENFGKGSTSVTTVGAVTATTGNSIFALSTGGDVTVTAGDVTSTGNTAIFAQQSAVAGTGDVNVTTGDVSGTTGIYAVNSGTGGVGIIAHGTVTGTAAEGILTTGKAAVSVTVDKTVTGATKGLSLVGGTGGTGNISVTGAGGFVGGSDDAANIQNNGAGTVTVDIAGASSSTGGNGVVVRDTALGGEISVTTGAVTALTAGKNGIDVLSQSSTGNLTEVANGDVKAGNAGMVAAIFPAGATGDISVTAKGAIDARFGVDAENFGTGSTSVTTVGPVTATTGNGIFALSTGGDVTVTAGDVTSTGNTAIVALQTSGSRPGDLNVTTGDVSGTTGIYAVNSGTGVVGIVTHGTVTGTAAEGIFTTGNDAVSVTVDKTVAGATRGLSLVGGAGGSGNISVTGAGGFVGGSDDAANIQNNGAGTVTVDISGASSSTGGNGVVVRDTFLGGDISVTTGAVTALTADKNGIDVLSQSSTGNLTEVANGDVKAGNAGMVAAIFPAGATGDISVTANGGIDARFGVDAENFGKGSTSVTTVGAVTATTGNGIFALSTGGDVTVTAGDVTSTGNTAIIAQQTSGSRPGDVNVTTGDVSGTTGIYAVNSGTGVVGIIAHGTVTGTAAEGILTTGKAAVSVTVDKTVTGATKGLSLVGGTGGTGNISVTGAGGFVGGSDDAANIQNNGSGTVTVDISGASSSTGGNGVIVRDTASGGDISVTSGAVTAGQNGIDVQTLSTTANLTEVANGDVTAGDTGMVAVILPSSATGDINVTANGGIDARFGVDAENLGKGSTSVTTIGPVTVTTGNGVFARSTGGDITVTAGDVTSTGATAIFAENGLSAPNSGAIDVTLTAGSTINANAAGAFGIRTDNGQSSGTTTITVDGTIHAGAAGVSSYASIGNIVTNVSATGVIDPLIGIDQATVSGAITVNNSGLIGGDNIGVRLTSTGLGAVGALTVNQVGGGAISGGVGADLAGLDAALAVNNAGLITGTSTGLRMTATGAGSATIVNSGTITGGVSAIVASLNNGRFTLTNTGTVNGEVDVSGSNPATSTVTNAAGAVFNFGPGASSVSGSFVNAGTANVGAGSSVFFAGDTVNSNRINFVGAGVFTTAGAMTNTGIINAQNNLTGNVVTVGGNYIGGGQFFADYSTVTATADHLNIGGSASGITNVTMNRVGARSFVTGGFLPVVTVTGGAAATAFGSNTVFTTTGLVLESFGQNPSNAHQFGLIQQINPSARAVGDLAYAAEAASELLDEPISPYVTTVANPAPDDKRFGLWIRGATGHTKQTIASTISGGGVTVSSDDRVRTGHQAVQVGADVGLLNIGGHGWDVHLGVTTGWFDGDARLSATEKVKVNAPFFGGYVAAGNGPFAIDGTIRHEWRHYDLVLPSLFGSNAEQKVDGGATAESVHASYRIAGPSGIAATPFLGYDNAEGSIDDLTIDSITAYTPGDHKTQIGQAGIRLSYRAGSEDRVVFEPFASVALRKNWSRTDQGTFAFGAPVTSFVLDTRTWEDARRYSVGITGHARNGQVSAFVVGNFDDGSDLHGFTINGGLRVNF